MSSAADGQGRRAGPEAGRVAAPRYCMQHGQYYAPVFEYYAVPPVGIPTPPALPRWSATGEGGTGGHGRDQGAAAYAAAAASRRRR